MVKNTTAPHRAGCTEQRQAKKPVQRHGLSSAGHRSSARYRVRQYTDKKCENPAIHWRKQWIAGCGGPVTRVNQPPSYMPAFFELFRANNVAFSILCSSDRFPRTGLMAVETFHPREDLRVVGVRKMHAD